MDAVALQERRHFVSLDRTTIRRPDPCLGKAFQETLRPGCTAPQTSRARRSAKVGPRWEAPAKEGTMIAAQLSLWLNSAVSLRLFSRLLRTT